MEAGENRGTPWLNACKHLTHALDWLADIRRVHGHWREEALSAANRHLDLADVYLALLSDPEMSPYGAHAAATFAKTRTTVREITAAVRQGFPPGSLFRHIALRDIATNSHSTQRLIESGHHARVA